MLRILNVSWIDVTKIKTPKSDVTICVDACTPATIFYQAEPEAIGHTQSYMLNNWNKYRYILTFNATVLERCPNARKVLFGMSWITKEEWESVDKKEFLLTFIVGNKIWTEGHQFRHKIYMVQEHIQNIPILFFRSHDAVNNLKDYGHNPILKDDRKINMLRDSQFHLVVENSRQENYFSEKLCDALITKNIPIYYGCPNIHEYFDTTGWIILDSNDVNALMEKISCLNNNYYNTYIDTVNKNFNAVMKYVSIEDTINRTLELLEDY